jgi:gamma-glutamyltranspeptidase / glutathione hydrolase
MTRGMIVAPQPEAVEAGAEMLRRGGNAVDAAIACALVQGVVDPMMTGIAGFGSLQLYLPRRGEHLLIEFHGRAPAAARPDMWADLVEGETRDGFGFILRGRVNDVGYRSITVPGSLKAYAEAHAAYGALGWRAVMAPAIAHANEGFVVRPHVHAFWTEPATLGRVDTVERLRLTDTGRRVYFTPAGELHRPGDRVVNPDMAQTLSRIADDGAGDFYTGTIAKEIATDMERHGGLLTLDDLRHYRTTRTEPLWTTYRGHRVATNRPPGGGVTLVEMLNILEPFDLRGLGHNSPGYVRIVAEAMKRATIDKDRHVGDPAFVEVPLDRLADKGYAAKLAHEVARGVKARVPRIGASECPNTTQVSAVDAEGNAVSMTHSLGMPSGVITDGLGFMWNGCMGVFDPRPGRAGSIAAGKSRFSTMCPTIVFRGAEPFLVLGAPGGAHIAIAVLQVLLNVIDFGMPIADAVAAPRFSAVSDVIDVSNRIPRFVTRELEAMGYTIARSYQSYAFAAPHAVKIDAGIMTGGADPGRDGMALSV